MPTAKHLARRHVGHCRRVRSLTEQLPPKRQGGRDYKLQLLLLLLG